MSHVIIVFCEGISLEGSVSLDQTKRQQSDVSFNLLTFSITALMMSTAQISCCKKAVSVTC